MKHEIVMQPGDEVVVTFPGIPDSQARVVIDKYDGLHFSWGLFGASTEQVKTTQEVMKVDVMTYQPLLPSTHPKHLDVNSRKLTI